VARKRAALATHLTKWGQGLARGSTALRSKKGGFSLSQCPSIEHGASSASVARRAHVANARAAPPLKKERAQWRASALHAQPTSPSEDKGWHVGAPPCEARSAASRGRGSQSLHALRKDAAQARSRTPSVQGNALTFQPWPSLREVACSCSALARHCALSHLGEEAQHARFRSACATPRRLESTHALWKATAPAGRPSPSVHGRAPTCQPLSSLGEVGCACSALARHCARSLLGGGAARALATCARPTALVGVGPCPMEDHCPSRTSLSLSARPCSDVPALAIT